MVGPWLFYNAVVPLIPIGIVWLISWFLSKSPTTTATVFSIIKDGQVFFFCTALASAAIGDLAKARAGFDGTYWVIGLLFIVIVSAAAFAAAALAKGNSNEDRVGWSSVLAAMATIVLVLSFRYEAGIL